MTVNVSNSDLVKTEVIIFGTTDSNSEDNVLTLINLIDGENKNFKNDAIKVHKKLIMEYGLESTSLKNSQLYHNKTSKIGFILTNFLDLKYSLQRIKPTIPQKLQSLLTTKKK